MPHKCPSSRLATNPARNSSSSHVHPLHYTMLHETTNLAPLGQPWIAGLVVVSAVLYLLYSTQRWRANNLPLLNDAGPFDFLQATAVNRFRRDARQLIKSGFDSVSLHTELGEARTSVTCSSSGTSTGMSSRCARMSGSSCLRPLNMRTSSATTLR
jgi:hypothetical protein